MLEFGTLSRLTGDDRFEKAARKAFFALWNSKTGIGLVGNTIDIISGVCVFLSMPSPLSHRRDSCGCTPKSLESVQESTRSTSMR